MSEKLKVLSGKEIVKIFTSYGCVLKRTVGSHARLTYSKSDGDFHISVPLHSEVKKGMCRAIAKDFGECFGYDNMKKEFYHE